MMKPRYSELATRLLARHADATRDGEDLPDIVPLERARAIGAIERVIAEKAQARRRARWLSACGAAAAVAAAFGMGRWATGTHAHVPETNAAPGVLGSTNVAIVAHSEGGGSDVSVTVAGQTSPLRDSAVLAPGSRILATRAAHATLAFSTGTQVALLPEADLTILREDATQEFRLSRGAVSARVAKLGETQRFLVHTPDADVEVRGTEFRVAVSSADPSCANGTVTRVEVSEGLVTVRQGATEAHVAKGEVWPEGCDRANPIDHHGTQAALAPADRERGGSVPVTALPPAGRRDRQDLAAHAPRSSGRSEGHGPSSNASSLAAQNELFADAIEAKRKGMSREAVQTLDRLLTSYPESPLAESAAVERLRLLRANDPNRAATAAREYLVRFPDGFARAEAEAILAERQ